MNLIIIIIISIILIIILSYIVKLKYREYKFKNQKYITINSNILITGGCCGIGYEIIKNLIFFTKCKIINLDIRKDLFSKLEKEFKSNLKNYFIDLSINQNFETFFKKNNINLNEIDILINNAGIAFNLPIEKLSIEKMNKTIQTNLITPMNLINLLINNHLKINNIKNKKLHIVTIASTMSHLVSQKSSDYVASKWGLYAFHESIRAEYLYNNDFIFTIFCPFCVNTGMFNGFKNPLIGILKILDVKEIGKNIVKSIILKDKIIFYPEISWIIIYLFKLFPVYISDFIQYYFFGYATKNLEGRKENDYLFKLK